MCIGKHKKLNHHSLISGWLAKRYSLMRQWLADFWHGQIVAAFPLSRLHNALVINGLLWVEWVQLLGLVVLSRVGDEILRKGWSWIEELIICILLLLVNQSIGVLSSFRTSESIWEVDKASKVMGSLSSADWLRTKLATPLLSIYHGRDGQENNSYVLWVSSGWWWWSLYSTSQYCWLLQSGW